MEKKMFDQLMESIRQGKAIMAGELEPSRRFKIDELDVKIIRKNFHLS